MDIATRFLATHTDASGKVTLERHITDLVVSLDNEKAHKDPLTLEAISTFIKNNRFSYREPKSSEELSRQIQEQKILPNWLLYEQALLNDQAAQNETDVLIQNFEIQDQSLFKAAGLSMGQKRAHLLQRELVKLRAKTGANKLRFWGRILTASGDYYVVQGILPKKTDSQIASGSEKYREGANSFSYWVKHSNHLMTVEANWFELPLVTPEQVRTARLIKRVFTGNLEAPILSNPQFPGQEKHLLAAQIIRITHACEISPKGMYAPLEDNPDDIDFAEDFKIPQFADLSNLQNWVHSNTYILGQGRSTHYLDPSIPEDQREEAMAKLTETDPKMDRLKGINQDKPYERFGLETPWIVRTIGDPQIYNNIGKDEGTTSCYAVLTLRNPAWPGWITVSSRKQFGSIYVGYGYKATQLPFYPVGPSDLLEDPQDVEEFGEPNPKNPPDEIEPDSDDEKKKEQS